MLALVGDTWGSRTALWGPQGERGHQHGPGTLCLVLAQGSSSDSEDRAGAGGAAGTPCVTLFSPPSSYPRQTQAMEANHMPHQRGSPFICPNPRRRGLFADPAHLPLKEAATKVDTGPKTASLQPAPSSKGSARLPQGSHHPWAPRGCGGESRQQRVQARGPCPHLPNGDQKE